MSAKLVLADVADLRAYERQREDFRRRIIALKKLRRVAIGPVVSVVFECRETILFQVQEMARAERMLTDEAIQAELDTYNPLIPEAGELSATLFIELTSRAEMEEWLPKLVGVEHSVELLVGQGDTATVVAAELEESHASQLTRQEVTASVHYLHFRLPEAVIDRFLDDAVVLAVNHPSYTFGAPLSIETKGSLFGDLRPAG
jgi:hypothetical protein